MKNAGERGNVNLLHSFILTFSQYWGKEKKVFYSSVEQVRKLTLMTWAKQVTILLNTWELLKLQRKKYTAKFIFSIKQIPVCY